MAAAEDDGGKAGSTGKAIFMGVLLIIMFLCLFFGIRTPETVVSEESENSVVSPCLTVERSRG